MTVCDRLTGSHKIDGTSTMNLVPWARWAAAHSSAGQEPRGASGGEPLQDGSGLSGGGGHQKSPSSTRSWMSMRWAMASGLSARPTLCPSVVKTGSGPRSGAKMTQ